MWKNRQALPCLISVLLVFLPSASSFHSDPKYMVLVPSQLYTETPEKICLHLYHLNETVTVRATLQFGWGNRSLFNELVVDKDLFHCVSFTLPRLSLSEEKVSLSVHIQGPTHEFRKKTVVLVKNKGNIVFLQTDKPAYKPGQSVNFRVVSVDKNLHPLNELFPVVYIEDPKTNQIMQWQNINTENGLKQLSFSLSPEAILGSYKIVIIRESGVKKEHSFTVEEFVLPRFEVQVKVPKAIYILDEKVNVTACAVYTHGKPVSGHANISICLKYLYTGFQKEPGCIEVSYQLDKNGCTTQEQNISVFQLKKSFYDYQYIHVNAKVIEEGTGFEFSGSGITKIKITTTKLVFVKPELQFRPGIPFHVKVRLMDLKNVPLPNEQVFIKQHEADLPSATITDQHGLAEFSINTTGIQDSYLSIKVYHKEENSCFVPRCMTEKYAEAHLGANRVYTVSRSYVYLEKESGILPCSQIHTVKAQFIVKGPVLLSLREIKFYYLVMAQGKIIHTGSHTHHMEPSEFLPAPVKGNFTLEIPVEFGMAPVAKMLIYAILPDGEVIADSAKFEIEKCLLNKVDLSFNPARSLPASQTHLRVTASPQSLCGLRAVDQSVLLLRPEAELSPSWIYNLPEMQHKDFIPRSHQLPKNYNCITDDSYSGPDADDKEVYDYIEDMGLQAFTNLKIKHPKLCRYFDSELKAAPIRDDSGDATDDPTTETFRKYLPETWVWDLVTVNSSGVAEVELTVPNNITEWNAGAFCLSNDTGLGLSPVVSLQTFQPFFEELTMPYSVLRGTV